MTCYNKRTREKLVEQVEIANTFWARLKGLMFRKTLSQEAGLLLDPCPQIHTCFMRFAIDVVFLDHTNRVIAVLENMKPWRMSKFYRASRRTLEVNGGLLQGRVRVGDELDFN